MEEMRGAGFAGSASPFLGREWAAINVDVGPERRSPRYHETSLALESVEETEMCVVARARRKEACRLPVRVQKQQALQLAMNPPEEFTIDYIVEYDMG